VYPEKRHANLREAGDWDRKGAARKLYGVLMPHLTADDGVKLYYEEAGSGIPVVFVHEFAGDYRSFEQQVRYFSRGYRCIVFNARGYPPSDVPDTVERYSQNLARDDIRAVLDALQLDKAHILGLSMGGFASLHFGFTYPDRVRSLVIAGCGYGAAPDKRQQFVEETEAAAARFEAMGMAKAAEGYALGPSRVQLQNKDPRGWREFADQLAQHSTRGAALTMRGVQKRRPSLFDLVKKIKTVTAPTLIMSGDEDFSCLEPALLLKRTILASALVVLPNTGHAINLEEPAEFNRLIGEFLHGVDTGQWRPRDPRAMAASILGK
jgi:pimeloyl-ACP methyl ester carboxylesterase